MTFSIGFHNAFQSNIKAFTTSTATEIRLNNRQLSRFLLTQQRFFRICISNKFAERNLFIEYANVLFPIKTFQNFVKLLTKFITHLYCSFRPHSKYGENITRKKLVQSLSSLYAQSNSYCYFVIVIMLFCEIVNYQHKQYSYPVVCICNRHFV